ncbi:MAG: LytR family transcriptional regulator [Ectobacillus sp.]
MKKVWVWVFGILGALLLGAGIYAYNVYSDVSQTIEKVHKPLKREKSPMREEAVQPEQKKPVSILVIGADPRGGERGRSDSLMLLTLNAETQSMKIVSIPRDTYIEIVGKGKKDKINHAYAFGGIDMTVATVEKFLNVPVDYYLEVNMEGFRDVVDAVGGVDVNNDLAFSYEGHHFAKGPIHLNGSEALAYARMRKEDPRGDFGRQMRQRQVIQAVIRKGANISNLANHNELLGAVQKNVKTNLTQSEMIEMQQHYKECLNNTEELQIEGKGGMQNGVWYYFISEPTRQALSQKLRGHLGLQ